MEPNTNRMIFIGVGIENECYLEFDLQRKVDKISLTNGIREKYSINHFSNYKENVFENSLQKILTDKSYSIPVLMNSHSFTKTDVNNIKRWIQLTIYQIWYIGESILNYYKNTTVILLTNIKNSFLMVIPLNL
jgi:hypothetical protein